MPNLNEIQQAIFEILSGIESVTPTDADDNDADATKLDDEAIPICHAA